jgi:hypothetical protein
MKNNEHLALFVLGVGTLGITFLLLFALSDRNTASIPVVDKHIQIPAAQAAVVPQTQTPESPSMEVLDREVSETFAKTAAYLGHSTFKEKEHIALLERLEFYGGMSSIKPAHKKAAQDLIKDMDRLLTLKESVSRQVKLAGQISAAETDVQIHLAKGQRNAAVALKLRNRIESLYAIHGLSESQNRQLRTSLAALKSAYKATYTSTAAPAPSRQASAPKVLKPSAQASTARVPAPSRQASAPKVLKPSVPVKPKPSAPVLKAKVKPKTESKPVPKIPVAATVPKKAKQPDSQSIKRKYQRVMTHVSRYFVVRKYDRQKHDELTADLNEISKSSSYLSNNDQYRLSETIAKMKRIDTKYRSRVAAK